MAWCALRCRTRAPPLAVLAARRPRAHASCRCCRGVFPMLQDFTSETEVESDTGVSNTGSFKLSDPSGMDVLYKYDYLPLGEMVCRCAIGWRACPRLR